MTVKRPISGDTKTGTCPGKDRGCLFPPPPNLQDLAPRGRLGIFVHMPAVAAAQLNNLSHLLFDLDHIEPRWPP